MQRIIIGTAGHIDHGKTALVKALTGVNTDRLKEEKKRGISIELGFAPLQLPSGSLAGLVDVPGHERFIKQMLAGAFGMDLVLLVIAADEGVMPQTAEHLDIIDLLGIDKGIIVLTKTDLVDEEWLMMVEEDVASFITPTVAASWPTIAVSAYTGANIPELLALIDQTAGGVREKTASGFARLPIDRVFSMTGFGTVVTGTLWSGSIKVNDVLEIMPAAVPARIRNLQVHNSKVEEAMAGQRVAANLQGVDISDVKRGDLLITPGKLQPTYRVNGALKLLESSPRSLKNWARIRFHLGTAETMGRVILLEQDEMMPGEQGYVQIVMEKPVVCAKNDRFILRFYSPVTTIGGGMIIDPHPGRQKRFNEEVLQQMAIKQEGSTAEILEEEMERGEALFYSAEDLSGAAGTSTQEILATLEELETAGIITRIAIENSPFFISTRRLQVEGEKIKGHLDAYRRKYPLRRGYPREEMRSRFYPGLSVKGFNALTSLLEDLAVIANTATSIQPAGENFELAPEARACVNDILARLNQNPFSPPGLKEIEEDIAGYGQDPAEIIAFMESEGMIVKLAEGLYLARTALESARETLDEHFADQKELSLGQARDLLQTSRRFALPLLEYFDRIHYTRRLGDNRVKMGK